MKDPPLLLLIICRSASLEEDAEQQQAINAKMRRVGADGDVPPGDRNAFLSFSGGARSCVGRKFAMQEAVIILAVVLRSLKFEVDDDYTVEPFRRTPRGGMPMKISRRS